MAYLVAARLEVAAAVIYGGGVDQYLAEKPRCPTMFHFGEKHMHIPVSTLEKLKEQLPEGTLDTYRAGHGFNCLDRESYDPAGARLALKRSVDFFHQHMG